MSSEEEVLDQPDVKPLGENKFKSRIPSDLMIVLGVLHVLFGLICMYFFFYSISVIFRVSEFQGESNSYVGILRIIFLNNIPFLFGLVIFVGGVGLIRHKLYGWKYALGAATFAIGLPLLKEIINLLMPGVTWTIHALIGVLFLTFFGLSFAFLLSNVIRSFYQPSVKDFAIAGAIALILSLDFLLIPLIY